MEDSDAALDREVVGNVEGSVAGAEGVEEVIGAPAKPKRQYAPV